MSTPISPCVKCGDPGSKRCSRCWDAPEYRPGDANPTRYCSTECQKADWVAHKSHCTTLSRRTKLLRAATILRAALLAYRERFFDIPLSKIELGKDGAVLYLYRDVSPRPFPNGLTHDSKHKEAALTHNMCTLAFAMLGPLTRKLLAGVASSIESLDLQIEKPVFRTHLVEYLADGIDSNGGPHTVLIVRLHNNEAWIIDTAGTQYGFKEVLVPFERYIKDRASSNFVNGPPTKYTACETTDLDFMKEFFPDYPKAGLDILEKEKKARLHFARFVENRVGVRKGRDLKDSVFDPSKDFGGSKEEFDTKFGELMKEMKRHLEGFK
ncbi:hypothetical protein FB45DRAFT_907040 [Roridomyces roridus]|uniref:MYND-type domain-containing protein n=1 Tax=Roridomyces roridus TaxID=1738132 RepID=A0AAD7FTI4_9AGAR|nr:hypothetical protein FB45DRAFT_907040 [Roridomyces roridus]